MIHFVTLYYQITYFRIIVQFLPRIFPYPALCEVKRTSILNLCISTKIAIYKLYYGKPAIKSNIHTENRFKGIGHRYNYPGVY